MDDPLSESTHFKRLDSDVYAQRGWCFYVKKYVPILEWLPNYNCSYLKKDISCGLTLGCVLIAQSLAHASLSNVSVIHGPYTCILPPLVYAVFGTCGQGSVGTGGLVALLTGLTLAQTTIDGREMTLDESTRGGAILAFMVGVFLVVSGVLQLSFMVRFLSRPALSGFVTGSALLIIEAMLCPMLGLPKKITRKGFVSYVFHHPEVVDEINWWTFLLSMVILVFLMSKDKVVKLCPRLKGIMDFKELVVLVLSAVFCSQQAEALHIDTIGKVPSGLPSFEFPLKTSADLDLAKQLIPGAVLIAMVVFISSFASAKKCALEKGYKVEAVCELFALGLANAGGALIGATPCQIGLSRSSLASKMGVHTALGSNVFVAMLVATITKFLSSFLFFVPRCALNTIIVSAASHLVEFHEASTLNRYRAKVGDWKDMAIWYVAFFGTLVLGAFAGMCVAVIVSLILVIYRVAEPEIATLGKRKDNQWLNIKRISEEELNKGVLKQRKEVLVCRLEGPLFYANSERFQDWLADEEMRYASSGAPVKRIVLSASSISFVDATAIQVMKDIIKSATARGVHFYIANAYGVTRTFFEEEIVPLLPLSEITLNVHDLMEKADEAEGLTSLTTSLKFKRNCQSEPALQDIAIKRRATFVARQTINELPSWGFEETPKL